MKNIKINRFIAYFIDLLIISILAVLVSKISFLNPNAGKYQKTYQQFTKYTEKMQKEVKTVNKFSDIITPEYVSYMHDLEYYGLSYTISEIVIIILYFTLFPIFNDSSTVGQRLMRLKVADKDGNNPNKIKHLLRSLFIPIISTPILYTSLLNVILIPLLFVLKTKIYFYINVIITLLFCVYCYIDIIMMLANEDGLSLHDRITKTKIISRKVVK